MNLKEYKIAIVIGTRAELIKTFPVMLELEKKNIPYVFIHSGQHSLGDSCDIFGVKRPDIVLNEEPKKSSRFNSKNIKALAWNFSLVLKIRRELRKLPKLEYVIYHGDTMTTASSSLASSKLLNPLKKYKSVHLEAGLRSWNNSEPFPEEIFRRVAGFFSEILLAPSIGSKKNIQNKNKEIIVTGNTIIDSVQYALNLAKKQNLKPLSKKPFGLISIHRHENLKNKKRMEKIVEILTSVTIPCYFAVHDNTLKKLKEFNLLDKLDTCKNIHLIEPMDYVSFIYNSSLCSIIICDGGSMQEESLIFAKPCILLRDATERQEGLKTNFQYLSKFNVKKTKQKINEYLSKEFKIKNYKNPYGDKNISEIVVERLSK